MSDQQVRLFVADPDLELVGRLRTVLAGAGMVLVGSSTSADAALSQITTQRPDVLVVDDAACTGTPAEVVRRVMSAAPEICVIVTGGPGTSPSLMGRAVAAGARGFLLKPYADEELLGLIREVTSLVRGRELAPATKPRGRIVSVYAPKGGAGATTVAVNLAVALATSGAYRVGLVDLDLQFGDVGVLLNLDGANSIMEVVGQATLSEDHVKDTFLRHTSGVRVLLAPDDVSAVETIEPGQVTRALEQLRGHFDVVICDLWSMYEQLTRDVLRMSDQIILVTTPDLPSLRDLRRVLLAGREDLRLDERATIVVNRASGKAGFSLADVGKVLGRPATFAIPSDGAAVTEAVNRGLSVMDTRVRTKVTKIYRELAARIGAVPARASTAAQLNVARVRP